MRKQESATIIPRAETGSELWRAKLQPPPLPAPMPAWAKPGDPEAARRQFVARLLAGQGANRKSIRPFSAQFTPSAHTDATPTPVVTQQVKPTPTVQPRAQQFVTHHRHLDYEQTHVNHQDAGSRFRDR